MLILRFTVIVLLLVVERFYILFQQQQQAGDGTFLWRHDVREQISVHAGSFFGSCVHSLESALLTMRFSGGREAGVAKSLCTYAHCNVSYYTIAQAATAPAAGSPQRRNTRNRYSIAGAACCCVCWAMGGETRVRLAAARRPGRETFSFFAAADVNATKLQILPMLPQQQSLPRSTLETGPQKTRPYVGTYTSKMSHQIVSPILISQRDLWYIRISSR